jgi:hypothetical protein
MQAHDQQVREHLSPEVAQTFLNSLPEKIKLGLLTYAAQVNFPIEAVIEMAIAGFLDEDAVNFPGCNPVPVDFGRKPDFQETAQ